MPVLPKVGLRCVSNVTAFLPLFPFTSRIFALVSQNVLSFSYNAETKTPSQLPIKENKDEIMESNNVANVFRNLSPTYNIASYVNKSKTLQELINLGVNLSRFDKNVEQAEFLLKLDFEEDVKPYILFLHDHGIAADQISEVLTKNIEICKESLDDLKTRINYLEYKKFSKENIQNIILRNPRWLSIPVPRIDQRLGWFQQNYKLSGDEVRIIVNTLPQIVTFNFDTIKLNNFIFEEEMGMTKPMVKKLLLHRPRLFMKNQKALLAAFEFVHIDMAVSLDHICAQPDILMARQHVIKERHKFLQSLGRAQYNPLLPGYVSLDAFIHCDDTHFATEIAKSMPVPVGSYAQGPTCFDRMKLGFTIGLCVGMASGALFGGYSALRYGLRGRELVNSVGKVMLQGGGTFGTFMAIGSGIRC